MNSVDRPQAVTRSDEGLKSLTKVVRVLGVFSRTARALSLAEICQRTGYPRSTTHRLLSSMREAGLLDQDRNRDRYRL
ncbi:helix-turn-helix domain-containing protein, partial [Acinetobacter baumannii]